MKSSFQYLYLIFIVLILLLIVYQVANRHQEDNEISWVIFEQKILKAEAVDKVKVINGEYAEIYLLSKFKSDSNFTSSLKPYQPNLSFGEPQFYLSIASAESFEKKLSEAEIRIFKKEIIPVTYSKRSDSVWPLFTWLIPFFLIMLFLSGRFSRMTSEGDSSIFNFNKTTATLADETNKDISFKDVAGLEEAEMEVREIVDFLKNPSAFTALGAKIPKGIILVGPPGTGKTLLAKAVAGEARVPFFSISGSEFVEMFVGVGASRVRDLFKKAKEKSPCIIFIDEIDAIGRSRSKNTFFTGSNDERESTLNQLLTEMDGFSSNSGVIVLAATNRGDMLDPALLRAGRFDRHIYLELPNQTEREDIFKVHMRPLITDNDVDIHFLAAQTPGFSGADIANLCNEAALIAARLKKKQVQADDFLQAIDRIVAGAEKKSKIISASEKRIIAYHEAGHALVSWKLKNVDPLVKVSIIPRGKSLGSAWYLPEEKQISTYAEFKDQIAAALGGRAAEELIFGEISSGAMDDLAKVTRQAYMMVCYFGFSKKIGPISYYGENENNLQKPYSEEMARMIDEEVRAIIHTSYELSKEVLLQYKTDLIKLAEQLLEHETVSRKDLEALLGERNEDEENPLHTSAGHD